MKAMLMKSTVLVLALASCIALQGTHALEATALPKNVREASPEVNIAAQNSLISAAITKVNKDLLAILTCNKRNKFYKPADGTADTDGCVGATVSTTTATIMDALPKVEFDSYPGYVRTKKGFSGSSTRHISLAEIISKGATSVSVKATKSGFIGNCQRGDVVMNIANLKTNVTTTTFQCHYDNSPNRSTFFSWSYDASSKMLAVQARMAQTKTNMANAALTGMSATYEITKTVLRIGDGK